MLRTIIFGLFFGSGMTALIYQVIWTRLLTLTFGVTSLAVSTVLTCFFGGLALGSYYGGRWVDKRGNGFLWYGLAEIIIGLYGILFLILLQLNNSSYIAIAQILEMDFYGQSALKFILSAILLAVPTTLMGATLPILSKALAHSGQRFAKDVGGLYTANTFGAITGTLLTAFYLLPNLGIENVLLFAGIINILIGAVAIYSRRIESGKGLIGSDEVIVAHFVDEGGGENAAGGGSGSSVHDPLPSSFSTLLVLGFAISGFTGLAYEVIWTKILSFILVSTVYAFATVLAAFLSGIAAGAFVFSLITDKILSIRKLINIFALVEVLIGLTSMALIFFYNEVPTYEFYKTVNSTDNWSEFLWLNFSISFVSLFIPTFLFGATFPLVCKIYSLKMENIGSRIGDIYSVNTVGGIFGSFLTGFVLIPFIGMQNALLIICIINIAIGLVFFFKNPLASRKKSYAYSGATLAALFVILPLLPPNMPLTLNESLLVNDEVVAMYAEGPTATVLVAHRKNAKDAAVNKRLWINGNQATAAYYEGLQINRFQGVLPMVLHPDPKDVLVICFGSGTTFGTLSQFDVNQVDNVEISRTVIKGAPLFKVANKDVLNNPKSNIIFDDGRSYLSVTKKKYDVITEEPMHPALAGVINLYTKEYYEVAKAHLKPGGIMSQWIPLYALSVEDVRMLTATFKSVFPHTTLWIASADMFLIGSETKGTMDYGRLVDRISKPHIDSLLSDVDFNSPGEIMATFLMNEDQVAEYVKGAPIITDNWPIVEFTGPESLSVNTVSPNIAELLKYREPINPYLIVDEDVDREALGESLERKFRATRLNLIGRAYYTDGNFKKAMEYYQRATQIDPDNRNSIHYIKKLSLSGLAY